jgi:hypothetical protein
MQNSAHSLFILALQQQKTLSFAHLKQFGNSIMWLRQWQAYA